ncbi:MAG: hypothetical protein NZL90_01365 [Aquificaceae bacterium]|nr:hypothetical protein [Aquificaceae bacterium]MDW8237177.1 hypothetical protein [Aquificaceae bacterium]
MKAVFALFLGLIVSCGPAVDHQRSQRVPAELIDVQIFRDNLGNPRGATFKVRNQTPQACRMMCVEFRSSSFLERACSEIMVYPPQSVAIINTNLNPSSGAIVAYCYLNIAYLN